MSIEREGILYYPAAADEVSVEWEREGTPGKLCFRALKDETLDFQEGNVVRLTVDGTPFFYGYVFTKRRGKDGIISVTCYDQLRYFKNKGSRRYVERTAGELVRELAAEYGLMCGEVAETGTRLTRREDKAALFDMVAWALEETERLSGRRFVLYDDFGRLTLREVESMRLDVLIGVDSAADFDYESSIDGETYNSVKVYYENSRKGILEEHVERDGENVKRWGVLELYERVDSPEEMAGEAKGLLEEYNRKTRRLSVSSAAGDVRVRAGCLLPVALSLGDIVVDSYLLVESVKHRFCHGGHLMDLELTGGLITG